MEEKGFRIEDNAIVAANGTSLRIDFTTPRMRRRMRESWKNEPLLRAVGRKPGRAPAVFDATAGIGRDGFILAAHGCRVTMCEQNPLLAQMLAAALKQAQNSRDEKTAAAAARITLIHADSVTVLEGLPQNQRPETVYLDPMYPEKKKNALSGKEMQILKKLCGPSRDAELFRAAIHAATARVVVKRPKSAPNFLNHTPNLTIPTPAHRFQVFFTGVG